jgi:hypothetical protein
MKKGHSYISFNVKDKPSHPLVKALKEVYKKDLDEVFIIYASHWATDAGWTIDGFWFGFTLAEAIKNVKEGKFNYTSPIMTGAKYLQ